MAFRAVARSPAALVCTLVGAVAVGVVVALGVVAGLALRGVVDDPLFLGGLGHLLYGLLAALVLALAGVVWLPFGAGVAYAAGRRARGDAATVRETVRAVAARDEALYRWVRTRAAVGPVAERVLGEEDVAPNEVVVGCTAFVVPALVLDASGLRRAVELANRVTPRPGRGRVLSASLGASALASVVGFVALSAATEPSPGAAAVVAGGLLVSGCVVTAALDAAWRAEAYATADLSDGFVG